MHAKAHDDARRRGKARLCATAHTGKDYYFIILFYRISQNQYPRHIKNMKQTRGLCIFQLIVPEN